MILESIMNACRKVGYRNAILALERSLITTALGISKGSRTEAARLLGMNRPTLVMRIRALRINDKEIH